MNEELLKKARAAESPEELIKIAEEAGLPKMGEKEAKEYFEIIHKSGEIADEELEQAAGGCTDYYPDNKKRSVTPGNLCGMRGDNDRLWVCRNCGMIAALCRCYPLQTDLEDLFGVVTRPTKFNCGTCKFYKKRTDSPQYYCDRDEMSWHG